LRIGICDVDYANGLRCVVIGAPTGDRSPTLCITSSRSKLISTALRRGFRKRCPHCGEGPLFSGWSQFERCSICGLVFTRNPGDTWAFTILGNRLPIGAMVVFDLFRSGPFACGVGPRDGGGVVGAACLDGPQPMGRWYRAALPASVLARPGGSYPAAPCDPLVPTSFGPTNSTPSPEHSFS
jgi:hypothetical protein